MSAGEAQVSERDWPRVAWWLVSATLAYNVIEAVIALWAGVEAESIALLGFGLDSVIETCAAGVVLWRLQVERSGADRARAGRALGAGAGHDLRGPSPIHVRAGDIQQEHSGQGGR